MQVRPRKEGESLVTIKPHGLPWGWTVSASHPIAVIRPKRPVEAHRRRSGMEAHPNQYEMTWVPAGEVSYTDWLAYPRRLSLPDGTSRGVHQRLIDEMRAIWTSGRVRTERQQCRIDIERGEDAYRAWQLVAYLGCPGTLVQNAREHRYELHVHYLSYLSLTALMRTEEERPEAHRRFGYKSPSKPLGYAFWKGFLAMRPDLVAAHVTDVDLVDFTVEEDASFCIPGMAVHNCQEHIVPMRVIFPTAGGATGEPYSMMNLQDWSAKMQEEITAWKLDGNHIPIMPIPIGNQTLGGDGRALMLSQEMRMLEEEIISGLGVPMEFIKGGLSYGGTSLSMHMLKNTLETYRAVQLDLVEQIIEAVAAHLQWAPVKVKFKRFHMADDLQRASLSFQLNQAGKLSDRTLLSELNYDIDEEVAIIKKESARQMEVMADQQREQAHMQGDAMRVQQRYQSLLQREAQDPTLPEEADPRRPSGDVPVPQQPAQMDLHETARQMATQLLQMSEESMYANLKTLLPYPELHAAVMTEIQSRSGRPDSSGLPLPQERPPRRGPGQGGM